TIGSGQHYISELAIHCLILLPVTCPEYGTRMRYVTQRPQPFIRESVVITFFFLLREPNAAQCVMRIRRRHADAIFAVDGLAISIATAMCHPRSVAGIQYRLQCRH